MKRNNFIISLLAAAAAPVFAFAGKRFARTDTGFKVKAGEGRIHGHLKLKGVNSNILDVKISGSDTDGGFAMFEQTSLSQGMGTPLHIHPLQDEVFYVLEGEYYFQVGSEKFRLYAGESIFLPKNLPHAWTQVAEKGKMVVTFQPAGKMEDFFVTVSSLTHEPTKEEMSKIFLDNGMRMVGPPLKVE